MSDQERSRTHIKKDGGESERSGGQRGGERRVSNVGDGGFAFQVACECELPHEKRRGSCPVFI